MLQIWMGIAGTGKTTELLSNMRQRAQQKQHSLFLVPEQFSSSAEALVYRQLGDAHSAFVQVVSFRTLAERILRAEGGLARPVLSDASRAVFVRRALGRLGGEARGFVRQRHSAAFCAMCAQTINELKTAGATPQLLRVAGAGAGEPKLGELALVFEAYEQAIQDVAMDPQDRLAQAAQKATAEYLAPYACFIDNFDGFTAPEYALLERVLACCGEMHIALCCDGLAETANGLGVFSPVRRTAQRMLRMAAKLELQAKAPIVLQTLHRCGAPGIAAANLLLANGQHPAQPVAEGVTLTQYADEWQEARAVAAQMHHLALQGVPYSRMAVVCRDIPAYKSSLQRAFALFEIPYFVDAAGSVEYTAPVAFLRGALRLLREGLGSGGVLDILKSGLCGAQPTALAALENYVFTWNPKAAEWRAPFDKNPAGLLARQDDEARRQLELAEGLRAGIVPRLEEFLACARGAVAAEVSKQLYLLLESFDAGVHIERQAAQLDASGEVALADKTRRAWDVAMDLLEQMKRLVGEEKLSPAEFDELLLLLVRTTDFGQAPQTLECVVFTSADRMRLADPDHCFVVGVCEGEFPMQVGYSGLLTHTDRELLVAAGVEMPGSFENRVLLEDMFFYRAMTAPRSGLYISWALRRAGAQKNPSAALEPLRLALHPPALQQPDAMAGATPAAAYDALGMAYRENEPKTAAIYAALAQHGGMDDALRLLDEVDNDGECEVGQADALLRLVGKPMTLSATRAQSYYSCRYAYYMERVLGVRPRRKAEISPMESGTIVHYVLEQTLREAGGAFAQLGDDALEEMAARHTADFVRQNLPDITLRQQHQLARMRQRMAGLLQYMRDAAQNSDFVIDALELPLADSAGGVPPLVVQTPGGHTLRVTGAIDRVDTLKKDGKTYISIIDYKTGSKTFNLRDIYCGLNMQMMIYMHTLQQNATSRYPNAVPAGVLYLMSDPPPVTGAREGGKAVYKVDGLLLRQPDVLRAMDKQQQGGYIPVVYNKDGTPRKSRQLASLEKMGNIGRHVQRLLEEMADGVYSGSFPARPLVEGERRPCDYCAYRAACRHEDGRNETQLTAPDNVFEENAEQV